MSRRLVYKFGAIEIDAAMRGIRRDGDGLHLRARSFDVLLYLIENRGSVVTKEVLLDKFWRDTAVTDNTLAQSIKDIRQAVGDDPKNPTCIRTIARVGYSFIAPLDDPPAEFVEPEPVPPPHLKGNGRRAILATLTALVAIGVVIAVARQDKPAEAVGDEIAWWRFDEGQGLVAFDSSHSNHNGALVGVPHWTEGKLGKALQFDGLTTFATGVNLKGFPLGNAPRTIMAWIKPASNLVDDYTLFHYGATWPLPPGGSVFLVLTRSGRIRFGTNTEGKAVESAAGVADDDWHHVTATWDGSTASIYIDGILSRASRLSGPLDTGDASGWAIGRALKEGTPFRGLIDEVRVYRSSLRPQEVQGLYRCSSGLTAAVAAGVSYYLLPVLGAGAIVDADSREIRNTGLDIAGMQFGRSDGVCSLDSLRGAPVAQNVRIQAEVLVPLHEGGRITEAGPYFRSRRAYVVDSFMGGTSAGYFVQLDSKGVIKVRRLNPQAVVAFSDASPGFDPSRFHKLDCAVRGEILSVGLDGRSVTFHQGHDETEQVAIPPEWEKASPRGTNQGTAGIAFFAEPADRGSVGGQRARNVTLGVLD